MYFNSRPSARGDCASCSRVTMMHLFQFTPLREGRQYVPIPLDMAEISIHAPPRGATVHENEVLAKKAISIHAPPRGATAAVDAEKKALEISIHAPPRGATPGKYLFAYERYISIHAPPRGATLAMATAFFLFKYFNSRPSARGDEMMENYKESLRISIHAPPRGATRTHGMQWHVWTFQFTPLREGRRKPKTRKRKDGKFQFTPLREGRLIRWTRRKMVEKFQFTPLREGRRRAVRKSGHLEDISIHAPPRGATRSCKY